MASNVTENKRRYEGKELLDEFLLNQVAKEVNVFKLCLFAKDLGIPQTEYQKITAPNTFTKDEQILRVSFSTLGRTLSRRNTPHNTQSMAFAQKE